MFLGHGLLVAFFIMTSAVAAATYWRVDSKVLRIPAAGGTIYLSFLLLLCKTLGASDLWGGSGAPGAFHGPHTQLRITLVLVTIALLYPALRAGDLIPTRTMVEMARSIDEDRAESLQFRFENEDQLLDRAWQRFLFGWGRFGRNRVYDESSGT